MRFLLMLMAFVFISCSSDKKQTASVIPWGVKRLGVATFQTEGGGIATDSSGKVYVVGSTNGALDGQTLSGGKDGFLTIYDANGTKISTTLFGGSSSNTYVEPKSVLVDANGDIYVAGHISGGRIPSGSATGLYDYFITKFDSTGNFLWHEQEGLSGVFTNAWGGLALDTSGNVYLCGVTQGNLNGATAIGSAQNAYIVKYDSSGTLLNTFLYGVTGATTGCSGIAVASSGNIYISAYTYGNLHGETLTGTYDAAIIKLDSAGTPQWTKLLGTSGVGTGTSRLVLDASENVYVAGTARGVLPSGSLPANSSIGTSDTFLAKYNSSGVFQYAHQMGVSGNDTYPYTLAYNSTLGSLYVVGSTEGNLNGATIAGSSDGFITEFNASTGSKGFTKVIGSSSYSETLDVALNTAGDIFVVAKTDSDVLDSILIGTIDTVILKYGSDGSLK
ncbi:MAG: SBBP repeat-containing protein [Bacteriovoracaceae bacterium]|nr:SBBP repeat-containing protein [Bacteriovoracaceae bacterium]